MENRYGLFTRIFMKQIHADVRKHFPQINPMKAASVTGPSFHQFFVQIRGAEIPALDRWFKAEDRYEARAKAWITFLAEAKVPGYADETETV